jgi:NnrU protein
MQHVFIGAALVVAYLLIGRDMVIYLPPTWGWHAAMIFDLLAALCLSIFIFRGALRQRLRFPLALSAVFWGIGHLFASGHLAGLILFGGAAIYGAQVFAQSHFAGAKPSPEVRGGHDLFSIVMGIAFFGIAVQLHGALIGVPVLVLAR